MRVLSFRGSVQAIGEAFGESCRGEIAELYALRVANALAQAKALGGRSLTEATLLELARRCLPEVERFDAEVYRELAGIARGSGLGIEQIWGMNALTDLRDVLAFADETLLRAGSPEGEGCSSFLVGRAGAASGRGLCGQTWDLATDNMPYVLVVERAPTGAPKTTCLTLVGCLSLIGMNGEGLAIGTTNIRTRDSGLGVGYLDVIHKTLRCRSLAEASAVVESSPRAGAHYFYLMDAESAAVSIECTAKRAVRLSVGDGSSVHCNHVLHEPFRTLEAETPMASSSNRQATLDRLLLSARGSVTVESLMDMLADHGGGPNAICRHDYSGISSNGAVIMEPGTRSFWAHHGPPCGRRWIRLSVA